MVDNRLPSVTAVADKRLQSLTTPGVRVNGPQSVDINSVFVISGRFIVTEDEFLRLGSSPHRNLVLTVLREPLYGSCHPLKNCMIFHDDVQNLSGAYSGWFSLDVWSYAGFRHPGIYHIRMSLGEALSNVIETSVTDSRGG
ncbi:MAG: hypothetical protein HKO88_05235 [Xanthomonadales bacterium]|nr:hypothetical protein [Xanthomonadales bacterium]